MLLDTKHFRAEFRHHFGVDGIIKVKAIKHPRKNEFNAFSFYGNTVRRGDQFFSEIYQVIEALKEPIGENIDVKV
jgi:hypothetical protein